MNRIRRGLFDLTRRPLGRGNDSGMTLIEMTVAMAIFAVLAIFMTTTLTQSFRLFSNNFNRSSGTRDASIAMERVAKDVRTAVPVGPLAGTQHAFGGAAPADALTATSITFTASTATDPVRERIYSDGANNLWIETTLPDAASVSPNYTYPVAYTSRIKALNGTLTSGAVFGYWLATDNQSTGTPRTSVAAADIGSVAAVVITLSVREGTSTAVAPVVLVNTVTPFNL